MSDCKDPIHLAAVALAETVAGIDHHEGALDCDACEEKLTAYRAAVAAAQPARDNPLEMFTRVVRGSYEFNSNAEEDKIIERFRAALAAARKDGDGH